jgi:hypothetical protein
MNNFADLDLGPTSSFGGGLFMAHHVTWTCLYQIYPTAVQIRGNACVGPIQLFTLVLTVPPAAK